MNMEASFLDKLQRSGRLEAEEYKSLLFSRDRETVLSLHAMARERTLAEFGHSVYLRGLLEISNICRNDCLYCGIRRSNGNIRRYRLTGTRIMDSCRKAYRSGFRTFVLQGGELGPDAVRWITEITSEIRRTFPDCAITLSLGEYEDSVYAEFRDAGADRYLLRHETSDPRHYARLHPEGMSLAHRMYCLDVLKRLGFQTGTGIMVASPYQTADDIVGDILFIGKFRPEMIGLGPFIPHKDTIFADYWDRGQSLLDDMSVRDAALELTLRLISIFRLMFPRALIPASTALATIAPDGRERGILAGANVIMPNITPPSVRDDYALYDCKLSSGAESAEGLRELAAGLERIGYVISWDRGDFRYE